MSKGKIHVVLLGVDSESPHDVTFDPLMMYFLKNFLQKEVTAVSGLATTLHVEVDDGPPQYSHPTHCLISSPASVTRTPPQPMLIVGNYNVTFGKALERFIAINRCPFHVLIIESDETGEVMGNAQFYKSARLDMPVRDRDGTLTVPLIGKYEYGITIDLLAKECLKTLSM